MPLSLNADIREIQKDTQYKEGTCTFCGLVIIQARGRKRIICQDQECKRAYHAVYGLERRAREGRTTRQDWVEQRAAGTYRGRIGGRVRGKIYKPGTISHKKK